MKSLGVILARRSSKRLPDKNLIKIGPLPLVGWMARAAAAASMTRVVVSTEDDDIAQVCEANGVPAPFRRPDELAADYAASPDILGHAIDQMNAIDQTQYDVAVLLQPTTPFVRTDTMDDCVGALVDPQINCAFAVRKVTEPPQWMFRSGPNGIASPLLGKAVHGKTEHTQFLEDTYIPCGAVYAVRVSALKAQNRIICDPAYMVEVEKDRAVDIDDATDLAFARTIYQLNGFRPVDHVPQAKGPN